VWAGQTAGGVREIQPVAEIMRQLVDEAEAALARAPRRPRRAARHLMVKT